MIVLSIPLLRLQIYEIIAKYKRVFRGYKLIYS